MPWQGLQAVPDQVKTHDGVPLTLEQANWVAAVADGLANREDIDDPWAVAWSRFEQVYRTEDGAWVKRETQEASVMSADTIMHVRASEAWHGLSADEVRERVYSAIRDRWPRANREQYESYEDIPPRPYLTELYEDYCIIEIGDEYWRYGYAVDPDTQDVTLAATGTQVAQEWVTVAQAGEAEGRRDIQTVRVHEFWPVGNIKATDVKNEWRVEFLAHGPTKDQKRYYTKEALEAATGLYEGARQYWNHASDADMQRGYRDARDLTSVLKNVTVSERGLQGTAHVFDPELNAKMQDEEFRKLIGLSHDSRITYYPKTINGQEMNVVTSILECYSVDWVPEGNAHGRVIEAAHTTTDEESEDEMKIDELDLDTLAQERPDIVEAIEARAREAAQAEATTADAEAEENSAPEDPEGATGEQQEAAMNEEQVDPRVQEAIAAAVAPLRDENAKLREELGTVKQERAAEQCLGVVRGMVAEDSSITEASKKRIVRQFEGQVIPAAEISAKVTEAIQDAREWEMETLTECAPTHVRNVGESVSAEDASANYEENLRAQLRAEGKTEDQIEAYMRAR